MRKAIFAMFRAVLAVALALAVARAAPADSVVLLVEDAPSDGLVAVPVDLTLAIRHCELQLDGTEGIRGKTAEGAPVPLQFVPDDRFNAADNYSGLLVMQLPEPQPAEVFLDFGAAPPANGAPWNGVVRTAWVEAHHDPAAQGGFPSALTILPSKKTLEGIRWADRVHHRELGSFNLANDPQPSIQLAASGPLCTVVRVRARYIRADSQQPSSEPRAVYDWFYFHEYPLVMVRARATQSEAFTWHEHHFLELQFDQQELPRWAGGDPLEQGQFVNATASRSLSPWALVSDGKSGVGMFSAGSVLVYDAPHEQGNYIQARGDQAWQAWSGTELEKSASLWIGSAEEPATAVRTAAQTRAAPAQVVATTDDVHSRIREAAQRLRELPPEQADDLWWQTAAGQLEQQGRFDEAVAAAAGEKPDAWTTIRASRLGLILQRTPDGVQLVSLQHVTRGVELAAGKPLPLFAVVLRNVDTQHEVRLTADRGWRETRIEQADANPTVTITWEGPTGAGPSGLRVVARLTPDAAQSSLRWQFAAENLGEKWSVWRVVFPQLAVAELGAESRLLYPQTCGVVASDAWRSPFRFQGRYPGGWTTMQFFAAYQAKGETGLYVAVHDPWGSTKELSAIGRPNDRAVELSFDHPAADMGVAGNGFELCGEAVWQLLPGDWYDAARIYRRWVRSEARWFPELTEDGRADTPLWMRQLPVWALGGGAPEQCVDAVERFARFLDVPSGFHWYNWHQIPFDNDYPHYFPAKDGFADGVSRLQMSGVYVMPYINGRLWDTRDRKAEDFQFTETAMPAVSKNEAGEPYTETYGSKEEDGSPVRLGVMCPTTDLWQRKQREIVLRLFNEYGVKGVYMDQIAAASPTLCFDSSHGHPLGGGHWWTEGYWGLLDRIRREMPDGCMLTTECNGEPYIRWFDGYLTWHWQYEGQVPAFPAVYGGSIQMFGRSYGGGPTRDLALRMRAAEQLVFGEQLGWINPGVVDEEENAAFFRRMVRLRWQLRRYFYAGEMGRPPRLGSDIPTVRADWQWHGERWVTTDAVRTGAWLLPQERRAVLLAVNVSDEEVNTQVEYDPADHGLPGERIRVTPITGNQAGKPLTSRREIRLPVVLGPRETMAWELGVEPDAAEDANASSVSGG